MKIVKADSTHCAEWILLRNALWPGDLQDHSKDVAKILEDGSQVAFLLVDDEGHLHGFIEGKYYTGNPHRYGHVEGWYVKGPMRGKGFGRVLMEHLEQWFLHHAIEHIFSDTIEEEYPLSKKYHLDNGYRQLFQLTVFVKESVSPSADIKGNGNNEGEDEIK